MVRAVGKRFLKIGGLIAIRPSLSPLAKDLLGCFCRAYCSHMGELIGLFITALIAALLSMLLSTIRQEAKVGKSGIHIVSCSLGIRIFAALPPLLFTNVGVFILRGPTGPGLSVVFFMVGLVAIFLFVNTLFRRIEFDDLSFRFFTPFSRSERLDWSEITAAELTSWNQSYVFTLQSGKKYRMFEFSNGMQEFLRKLSAEQWKVLSVQNAN